MKKTLEWAKKEIDLVGKDGIDKELSCHYAAAYSVLEKFLKETEDLSHPELVEYLLHQLILENPLTPIEDEEDEWEFVGGSDVGDENGWKQMRRYSSIRRPSLTKTVFFDKSRKILSTEYTDLERAECIDIGTQKKYSGGIGLELLNKIHPITFPYQPEGIIKIYTEEFRYHEGSPSESDTFGVFYFRTPIGGMEKVHRFFKKTPDGTLVPIDHQEYSFRRRKKK